VPFQNFGHLVVFPQPVKPVPFTEARTVQAENRESAGLETRTTADLEIGATLDRRYR
jgi:hypothetical protein